MWTFYTIIFKIYKAFKSFESASDQIAEYTKSLHKILPKRFAFMYAHYPVMHFMFLRLKLLLQACAVFYKQVCLILMWETTWVQCTNPFITHAGQSVPEGHSRRWKTPSIHSQVWIKKIILPRSPGCRTFCSSHGTFFPPSHCFCVIFDFFCVFSTIPI